MTDTPEFHDRGLSLSLARVSEAAALASAKLIGRGDEKAADQAAVNAMREQLNKLQIQGVVVIGEGERDEAPMLYIGEEVGAGTGPAVDIALDPLEGTTLTAKDMPNALTVIAMGPRGSMLHAPDVYMDKLAIGEEVGAGTGPAVDIALDPLEGTTLTAKDMPNALTVIAMGPRGSMLHAPDVYMDKLAIGPGFRDGVVTMDMTPSERVNALASAKGCSTDDITVCVLDRPRHEATIEEIRSTGAAVRLITDGDVAGVIHCAEASTGIDMYMGSGGAPEGVLAAAALKCMGGQMYGKLLFRNDDERGRASKAGITNFDRVYTRDDLVTQDVIFAATGVTDGSIVSGIKREVGYLTAETILMRSKTGSVRRMTYRNPV